ncbi:FecR family protein [Flavitalea flava]
MDSNYKNAEDFLADESFIQYCLRSDEQTVKYWEQWAAVHPGQVSEMDRARGMYFILNGNITDEIFEQERAEFVTSFDEVIHEQDDAGQITLLPSYSLLKRWLLGTAAAAAIAGGIWLGIGRRPSARPALLASNNLLSQESKRGERKSFQLSDGTQVTLNAGSTLTISADFGRSDRNVVLHGEAFFDVTHDKNHPFVIHTSCMDVKVLGTVFNVRAYDNDPQSETSLISGSVEVTLTARGNHKVILHPKEKIIYQQDNSSDSSVKQAAPGTNLSPSPIYKVAALTHLPADTAINEVSWLDNSLAFNQEKLSDIVRQLERWYNVSIEFKNTEIMAYRYTGVFRKKTIRQVLDALAFSKPFSYSLTNGNQIVINK